MRILIIFSFIVINGLGSNLVKAQPTIDVTIPAASCVNCHTTNSHTSSAIPQIAGQSEEVLRAQLLAFKSATPPQHTTIMDRLISGFTDEEIAALAHYFSQLPADSQSANKAP